MTIYLASDHIGFALRSALAEAMGEQQHTLVDLGTGGTDRVDYQLYARHVCERVLGDPGSIGILICRTGIGMSIMANRHKGIRAAVCTHEFLAEMTRRHNDANVLCLGAGMVGLDLALAISNTFISTPFEGGRHTPRVRQLDV